MNCLIVDVIIALQLCHCDVHDAETCYCFWVFAIAGAFVLLLTF